MLLLSIHQFSEFRDERLEIHDCPKPRKLCDRAYIEACHCNPKRLDLLRKKWYYYVRLKKVRGGVKGFGDTLVSKTCHFFRVSRKGAEGGGSLNPGMLGLTTVLVSQRPVASSVNA